MTAQLKIDQTGLPAGTAGKARTDGLSNGAVVTLENTGTGSSTLMRLLDVPPGDTTAVSSLSATGNPKIWTFTPTAAVYGSYLIELIEDQGQPSEKRERRVFGIRFPNTGLLMPALNERGDPAASLLNAGAEPQEAADDNSIDSPLAVLNTRPYAAWWRKLYELFFQVENAGGFSVTRRAYVDAASASLGATVLPGVVAAAAPTWTTDADIPPGQLFRFILYGPGCGGNGGKATDAANANPGGSAGGAGARREAWFTRQDLIDALPIVLSLPLGSNGSVGGAGPGNASASQASVPSGNATVGTLLEAGRGGAGAAQATVASQGGGGGGGAAGAGGSTTNSNAGAGGDPDGGASSSTGNNPSDFGGGSGGASAKGGDTMHGGTGGGSSRNNDLGSNPGGNSVHGPTGGGGGGGHNSARTNADPGSSGGGRIGPTVAGAAPGQNGADATANNGGMGGGGGAAAVGLAPQTAQNGGDGGLGGGGGGGGGSAGSTDDDSGNPNQAGNGGKGGDSLMFLDAYG